MPFSKMDIFFMKRALELAHQKKWDILPNPSVGAVIIENSKILGEGLHRGPGTPHAEVVAIQQALQKKKSLKNSTLYVTLEPCCHYLKKTPPCVPLLLTHKFKRIVIAHPDPNPFVNGQGIQQLKKAGCRVEVGFLEKEAMLLNQPFLKNQKLKMPYVTLKIATTFDGKMADDFGRSQWITTEEAQLNVHQLRLECDAITVGKNTIEKDNPRLNARPTPHQNFRKKIIIFGRPKNLSLKLHCMKANHPSQVIIITDKPKKNTPWKEMKKPNSLSLLLKILYEEAGICHLLLEGGPTLASSFLQNQCVDQMILYLGEGILGGQGKYQLGRSWGLKRLSKSIKFQPQSVRLIGKENNIRIQGFFHVYRAYSGRGKNY